MSTEPEPIEETRESSGESAEFGMAGSKLVASCLFSKSLV